MPKIENIGKCLTKTSADDFESVKSKYKWFIQISQWNESARRDLKVLPENLIPYVYLGYRPVEDARFLFGVSTNMKSVEWLADVLDSSD
jgi:hypothetical protein